MSRHKVDARLTEHSSHDVDSVEHGEISMLLVFWVLKAKSL